MGLDVYVMPLWRFKVGDFRAPAETVTGVRAKTVTADGIQQQRARVSWSDKWRAKRQIASIRRVVDAENKTQIRWKDDGAVLYSGSCSGIEPLRAYARWLDCRDRLPSFDPPPEMNYYKHPAMALEVDRWTCPHLVLHDCYNGYFLPCDFERVVQVEPYKIFNTWPASRSVGSSQQLVKELEIIQEQLQVPDAYAYPSEDPLSAVQAAYLQLRELAELSCKSGLPIIFCG